MPTSYDPYRLAQQQQAEAEALVKQRDRDAKAQADAARKADLSRQELDMRAQGMIPVTTADGNLHPDPLFEQKQAAKAAKEQAAAAKAAADLRNKQARADLTRKGVRHSINPVDGSPITHETEADVAARIATAEQQKRQQLIDDQIRKLDSEHDWQLADAAQQGYKPLRRNQKGERPLETTVLTEFKQQALFSLQSKLQQQAKAVSGGADWIPFNEAPTPEAAAAQERLTRLSQPGADLTEEDLAELEADDATKPAVAKIRQIQAQLAKDDELSQASAAHKARIASLKLKRDNPQAWLEAERQRRLRLSPEELQSDLEATAADLDARRTALEEQATALNSQVQTWNLKLETLNSEAAQRRQQGLTAGDIVTYRLEDGTTETWPADLAAKREEISARLQDTQSMQQDDWTRLKLEEQDLIAESGLVNEAAQHLNQVNEVQQVQQAATVSNRLRFTPGMEQAATEIDALQSDAATRKAVLDDMYPDGIPPEALDALNADIQSKAEQAIQTGQTRLNSALSAYGDIQSQLAANPDLHATAGDLFITARQQLAQAAGITEDEARRLLADAEALDWDQVTADEMNKGLVPDTWKSVGNMTQAEDARTTRTLSNGALIVHPRLSAEKDYLAAVEAADASPDAKADAIARYPQIRAAQARQTLETIQEVQSTLGPSALSDWENYADWSKKRPADVDEAEWALRWTEHNKSKNTGPLGTLLSKTKQFLGGIAAGGNDLRQQASGLLAGITGSEALMQDAQWAGRKAEAQTARLELGGHTSDNFLTKGVFDQLPRLGVSILPAGGGAKAAQTGLRLFAGTKLGGRLLPSVAAVVAEAKTPAQAAAALTRLTKSLNAGRITAKEAAGWGDKAVAAVAKTVATPAQSAKAVTALTRSGLGGAAAAGGAQTYGAQLTDIYSTIRRENPELSHTEALRQAQMPAIVSGLGTALITTAFGSTGISRLLTRPAEAKALASKVFTSQMQRLGFAGDAFISGGIMETIEESLDEGLSTVAAAVGKGQDVQQALGDFFRSLPEMAVATTLMGGAGQGIAAYQESGTRSNLPETVAPAWTAIEKHRALDATGNEDPALTEQQQRRATLALYLAQGGELTIVEADELAAAGWTRDGDKFKPLKDYAGPQVLDIDSNGLPVIKDSYIAALRQTGLAPVADAIGMTENETRNFYAQRNNQQPPGKDQPGSQQPQSAAAQNPAPDARRSTAERPVQAPAGQGTQPPSGGNPTAQPGDAVAASDPASSIQQPESPADFLTNHFTERGLPRDQAAAAAADIVSRPEFAGKTYEEIITTNAPFATALEDLGITGSLNSRDVATNPLKIQPGSRLEKIKALREKQAEEAKAAASANTVPPVNPVNKVPTPDFTALRAKLAAKEISDQDAAREVAQLTGATTKDEFIAAIVKHLGWKEARAEISANLHFGTKDESPIPLASGKRDAANRVPAGSGNPASSIQQPASGTRQGPDISLAADPSPIRRNRAYAADKLRVLAGIKDPSKKAWARQFFTALEQSLQRHHTLYDAYAVGGPARKHLDGQMTAVLEVEGKITRLIDLDAMVYQFDYLQSPQDALRATSIEEDIHATVLQLARENPGQYGYDALRQKWQALPTELKRTVWQAYRAANQNTASADEAIMPDLTEVQEWHMMNEFLRMLVQDSAFAGAITESVDTATGLIGWVQDLLRDLSKLLKDLMKKVQPDLRANLEGMVAQISDRLAQIEQASAAQKDRLAVLPSLRDPAAYADTVLQQVGAQENAGILSPAALARIFDQLDPALQSRAFALHTAGDPTHPPTPTRPRADKAVLMRGLLSQFLGSRKQARQLLDILSGITNNAAGSKSSNLLTKLTARFQDKTTEQLLAAQSPNARKSLSRLLAATVNAIGGFEAASFVHGIAANPAAKAFLQEAEPTTASPSSTPTRSRRWLLTQSRRPLRPGQPPPLTPGLTPPPPAPSARQQAQSRQERQQRQDDFQKLIEQEEAANLDGVTLTTLRAELDGYEMTADERDHYDASTAEGRQALRQILLARQQHARILRQQHEDQLQQALQAARGNADWESLVQRAKGLVLFARAYATRRFIFNRGTFATETEPARIGGWRLYRQADWRLAGTAAQRKFAEAGVDIDFDLGTLSAQPDSDFTVVTTRDRTGPGTLSHLIIKQSTLDDLATYLPATSGYLHHLLGTEADQRQRLGLPNENNTTRNPQGTAPDVSQEQGETPRQLGSNQSPSMESGPLPSSGQSQRGDTGESPAITPLAEGQSPFTPTTPTLQVSPSPSLPVSPSPRLSFPIPLSKRGQVRRAQFPDADSLAAFQFKLDADTVASARSTPAEVKKAEQRGLALLARLMEETGRSRSDLEKQLLDYHATLVQQAEAASAFGTFTPPSFASVTTSIQDQASSLPAPIGGDILSGMNDQGIRRLGPPDASDGWAWYRSLQADAALSKLKNAEAQRLAKKGDLTDAKAKLAWIDSNLVSQTGGRPIDEAAAELGESDDQRFPVTTGDELGRAILDAIDARLAAKQNPASSIQDQESSRAAEATTAAQDFATYAAGTTGQPFTTEQLAQELEPEDEIQIGTEWFTVQDTDPLTLDSARFGSVTPLPGQTLNLTAGPNHLRIPKQPASRIQNPESSIQQPASPGLAAARAELIAAVAEDTSLGAANRTRLAAASYVEEAIKDHNFRTLADLLRFAATDLPADTFAKLRTPHLYNAWNTVQVENNRPEATRPEEAAALRTLEPKVERRYGEMPPDIAARDAAIDPALIDQIVGITAPPPEQTDKAAEAAADLAAIAESAQGTSSPSIFAVPPAPDAPTMPDTPEERMAAGWNAHPEDEQLPAAPLIAKGDLDAAKPVNIQGGKSSLLARGIYNRAIAALARNAAAIGDMFFGTGTVTQYIHKAGLGKPNGHASEYSPWRASFLRQVTDPAKVEALARGARAGITELKRVQETARDAVTGSADFPAAMKAFAGFINSLDHSTLSADAWNVIRKRALSGYQTSLKDKDYTPEEFALKVEHFARVHGLKARVMIGMYQALPAGFDLAAYAQKVAAAQAWDKHLLETRSGQTAMFAPPKAEHPGPIPARDDPATTGLYIAAEMLSDNGISLDLDAAGNLNEPFTGLFDDWDWHTSDRAKNIEKLIRDYHTVFAGKTVHSANSWLLLPRLAQENPGIGFVIDPPYFGVPEMENGRVIIDTATGQPVRKGTSNYDSTTDIRTPDDLLRLFDSFVLPAWQSGAKFVLTNEWDDSAAVALRLRGATVVKIARQGRKGDTPELVAYNFNPTDGTLRPHRISAVTPGRAFSALQRGAYPGTSHSGNLDPRLQLAARAAAEAQPEAARMALQQRQNAAQLPRGNATGGSGRPVGADQRPAPRTPALDATLANVPDWDATESARVSWELDAGRREAAEFDRGLMSAPEIELADLEAELQEDYDRYAEDSDPSETSDPSDEALPAAPRVHPATGQPLPASRRKPTGPTYPGLKKPTLPAPQPRPDLFDEWIADVSRYNQSEKSPLIGFRGEITPGRKNGFGNTEGNGIYLMRDRQEAAVFGTVQRVSFPEPQRPFLVTNDDLYLLQESEDLDQPIDAAKDTPWLQASKYAAQHAHNLGKGKWNAQLAGDVLTKLLMESGYDSVYVKGMPDDWIVLLRETRPGQKPLKALKASARVLPPKPDLDDYPTFKGTQEERRAQWDKWHRDVDAWNETVDQFAARQGNLGTFLAAETTNSRGGVYREARVITRVPGSSTDWRTTIFGQQRITPTSTPVGDWANNAWVPIAHDEFPTKGEAYQSAVRGMPEDYTFSTKPLFAANRSPADDARFYNLTSSLPDVMTSKDIDQFKTRHPEKHAELVQLREAVLRRAGFDVPGYHGTSGDFDTFDLNRSASNTGDHGIWATGFHFAPDPVIAQRYGPKLLKTFLRLKNPATINDGFSQGIKDTPKEFWDAHTQNTRSILSRIFASKNIPSDFIETMPIDEDFIISFIDAIGLAGYAKPSRTEAPKIARRALMHAGYDGVIAQAMYDANEPAKTEYIVFEPSQIKSAEPLAPGPKIPPSQWANEANPSILAASNRRVEYVEPGFYSALAEAIRAKMPARGTPAQILGILKNAGLKAEEMKWTGIAPWLQAQAQDGPITQQQVLDYLATEGSVKFTLTRLQNPGAEQESEKERLNQRNRELTDQIADLRRRTEEGIISDAQARKELLTISVERADIEQRLQDLRVPPQRNTQWTLPGGTNPKEVVVTWNQPVNPVNNVTPVTSPNSDSDTTHYGDLDALAWYRTTDRTNAAGDGLLVEEFQSKWHQQGREKGYDQKPTIVTGVQDFAPGDTANYGKQGFRVQLADGTVTNNWYAHRWQAEEAIRHNPDYSGVPDAPYRTAWPLMLFKRALLDAVQSGKSWIGWTTGDTQAERYDLSKHVDSMFVTKTNADGDTYVVHGLKNKLIVIQKHDVPASELSSLVGKELAERIKNEVTTAAPKYASDYSAWKEFTGLDLRVGGHGMRKFYDEMLVKEFGKYAKQLGGGAVESSEVNSSIKEYKDPVFDIPSAEQNRISAEARAAIDRENPDLDDESDDYRDAVMERISDLSQEWVNKHGKKPITTPIHLIRITPQMRDSVSAGQALFAAPRRARQSMTFDPPFQAPFGDILRYEWTSKPVGGMDAQRISDWDNSVTNGQTGRSIVHLFKVRKPDGIHTVSLETAMGLLSDTQRRSLNALIRSHHQRQQEERTGQMALFAADRTNPSQIEALRAIFPHANDPSKWTHADEPRPGAGDFQKRQSLADQFGGETASRPNRRFEQRRIDEDQSAQRAALREIQEGNPVDEAVAFSPGGHLASGGEHAVYISDDDKHVTKITLPGLYGYVPTEDVAPGITGEFRRLKLREATPAEYLYRLALFSRLTGIDWQAHGVETTDEAADAPVIITTQPFVESKRDADGKKIPVTQKQIDAYMASIGFEPLYEMTGTTFRDDRMEGMTYWHPQQQIIAADARPANFNLTPDNKVVPIDLMLAHYPLAASDRTYSDAIEATGIQPAIQIKGRAYTGHRGMWHPEIIGHYVWKNVFTPQQRRDDPAPHFKASKFALEEWMDAPGSGFDDFGFIDLPTGDFVDRQEAYQRLIARGVPIPPESWTARHQELDSAEILNIAAALPASPRLQNSTTPSLQSAVAQAAAQTNTNATPAQREAENYKTGKVTVHGLRLSIENPAGSTRSGTDANGKPWSVTLPHHYGRILGTVGRDKDHLDFFLGPNPDSQLVLIVNQRKTGNGHFDEHKLMLGFNTPAEAAKGYLKSYSPGWKGLQSAVPTTIPVLKHWLTTHDTTQPVTKEQLEKLAKTLPLPTSAHDKPAVSIDTTTKPKPAHPPVTHTLPDGYHLTAPGLHALPASIRAHHGTPHKIDLKTGFSTSKIGSGEGAQAYGWGLYFAESMGLADKYRRHLTTPALIIGDKEFTRREGADAFAEWAANQLPKDWPPYAVSRFKEVLNRFHYDVTSFVAHPDEAADDAKKVFENFLREGKVSDAVLQQAMGALGKVVDIAEVPSPQDTTEGRWYARAIGWRPSRTSSSIETAAYYDMFSRIGWYASTFADAPARIRKEYRQTINAQQQELDRLLDIEKRPATDPAVNDATKRIDLAEAALDLIDSGKVKFVANPRRGNLYTVDLLGDPEQFLNWDTDLRDHPAEIRQKFMDALGHVLAYQVVDGRDPEYSRFMTDKTRPWQILDAMGDVTGSDAATRKEAEERRQQLDDGWQWQNISDIYKIAAAEGDMTPQKASEALAKAGIPGIRYLDGSSRTAGKGTHNYVIFDHKLVKIIAENGQPNENAQLFASNRLGTAITRTASAVATGTERTLQVANTLTDALGIQQPLATFGSNNLDKRLAAQLDKLAGPKVRSAKTAVETWLDKPEGLAPTIKGLVDQVLPTALIPREWLALHHEMQRKTAYGQETANDLIRALSGNPRLSDLAYPKEFAENPAARAQLFDAMEGRIPMATLPPEMQRLGQRLRDLLRQTGSELVRQGLMNPDTFEELQSNGWMPRYTEDEARESAGSFLAAFKLGVRDLLQQRSTAYHIVDTTRKDKTGQFVTVSRDEGGKRNRWRFRDAASRDAFYHDFVRQQTLNMLQDRSDRTVADMLAPLSRGDKMAMRDQIKSLTADQIANTAKLSPMLAGIVKQAKKHQYDRFLPKDPFEPAKLVKDPVYAVARYTLGQTHNASTMELLRKTAANPEWVSDIAITGYTPIPDASRFGPLAGKHVRKDIAAQILDLVDVPNAALQFYDGILRKWKAGKLVWNLGSHIRDAVGNTMFAYIAGSSIWNPGNWPHYQQAIAALRTGGKDFAELIEQQVLGGDAYSGIVKDRLKGLLPDPKTVENYDPGFVQRMLFGFGATLHGSHEFLSGLRRLPDDLFKAAAYFKAKADLASDPNLKPETSNVKLRAAEHVRKWFPYYDRLGQSGTTRAVGRFVNPFVSFFRESTRILGLAVVERPLALTASLAFPAIITAVSAMMLGLDDDDMEEIQKDMAGKGKLFATGTPLFSMLLPFRSSQGAVQQFDISAVMPFADLLGTKVAGTDATEDPWNRFWRGIVSGGPVLSLIDAWRHNEDAFTRRPIAEFGMTPLEKITAYGKHAAGVALPPLAPGGTAFNTLLRAGDRSTNKTLERYDPTQAVVRSVVGLNIKNATPDLYRLADDWRKAHGYEVTEGMDYGSTTPASRARKALFAKLAQDEPNLTAISNILKRLDELGHPVRTEQDINKLLFYRDPMKLIGGNKAKGITPQDAQAQFRASLQGEARQALERALQEYQRIKSKAPLLVRQAASL